MGVEMADSSWGCWVVLVKYGQGRALSLDVGFKSCLSHLTHSRPSEPVVLSELSKAVLFFSPSLSGDHLAIALLENGQCVGLFKSDNGL